MFSMHTAHLANVSKSVTKNATFPRTGRLPCLITQQLHVSQLLGDSFSVTQRPPSRDACSHSSMPRPHHASRVHAGDYTDDTRLILHPSKSLPNDNILEVATGPSSASRSAI